MHPSIKYSVDSRMWISMAVPYALKAQARGAAKAEAAVSAEIALSATDRTTVAAASVKTAVVSVTFPGNAGKKAVGNLTFIFLHKKTFSETLKVFFMIIVHAPSVPTAPTNRYPLSVYNAARVTS